MVFFLVVAALAFIVVITVRCFDAEPPRPDSADWRRYPPKAITDWHEERLDRVEAFLNLPTPSKPRPPTRASGAPTPGDKE